MNEEVKTKWLAALRGELEESEGKPFVQATQRLRDGDTYCCLGVLCELYARETGEGSWSGKGAWVVFTAGDGRVRRRLPPQGVWEWAGLDSANPDIVGEDRGELAALNDYGCTFDAIADLIEAQL